MSWTQGRRAGPEAKTYLRNAFGCDGQGVSLGTFAGSVKCGRRPKAKFQ